MARPQRVTALERYMSLLHLAQKGPGGLFASKSITFGAAARANQPSEDADICGFLQLVSTAENGPAITRDGLEDESHAFYAEANTVLPRGALHCAGVLFINNSTDGSENAVFEPEERDCVVSRWSNDDF
jgi:hypothetical protein